MPGAFSAPSNEDYVKAEKDRQGLTEIPVLAPLRYNQGISSSMPLVLRRYGGRMAEVNFSRCAAGRRSWTRGCFTTTDPTPVVMVRAGSWPLRTTWRRPRGILAVFVSVDPIGDFGFDDLGEELLSLEAKDLAEGILGLGQVVRGERLR